MDALYCAFCLVVRKDDLSRAVTICNGQACCFDHLYYVQGAEFNRILAIIKLDEAKQEGEKWKDTVKELHDTGKVIKQENTKAFKEELKPEKSILGRFLR